MRDSKHGIYHLDWVSGLNRVVRARDWCRGGLVFINFKWKLSNNYTTYSGKVNTGCDG